MNNKAPDTRNKLDNNLKNTKVIYDNHGHIVKRPQTQKKTFFSDIRSIIKSGNMTADREAPNSPIKLKASLKPSKGAEFKKTFGHSKTMKRNMRKAGIVTIGLPGCVKEYRALRKERRQTATKARQKKHQESLTVKRNSKSKGSPQKVQKVKKEKR